MREQTSTGVPLPTSDTLLSVPGDSIHWPWIGCGADDMDTDIIIGSPRLVPVLRLYPDCPSRHGPHRMGHGAQLEGP